MSNPEFEAMGPTSTRDFINVILGTNGVQEVETDLSEGVYDQSGPQKRILDLLKTIRNEVDSEEVLEEQVWANIRGLVSDLITSVGFTGFLLGSDRRSESSPYSVEDKIEILSKHGEQVRFYVDGSEPTNGELEMGQSMHALTGEATATYEAFDNTFNPNLVKILGEYVILKNDVDITTTFINNLVDRSTNDLQPDEDPEIEVEEDESIVMAAAKYERIHATALASILNGAVLVQKTISLYNTVAYVLTGEVDVPSKEEKLELFRMLSGKPVGSTLTTDLLGVIKAYPETYVRLANDCYNALLDVYQPAKPGHLFEGVTFPPLQQNYRFLPPASLKTLMRDRHITRYGDESDAGLTPMILRKRMILALENDDAMATNSNIDSLMIFKLLFTADAYYEDKGRLQQVVEDTELKFLGDPITLSKDMFTNPAQPNLQFNSDGNVVLFKAGYGAYETSMRTSYLYGNARTFGDIYDNATDNSTADGTDRLCRFCKRIDILLMAGLNPTSYIQTIWDRPEAVIDTIVEERITSKSPLPVNNIRGMLDPLPLY